MGIGERGEQRVAEVVLHLRPAEPWPQIRQKLHELRGHELGVVVAVALEEVEAARMETIGQAQDVDGRPFIRQATEDVLGQVAMRVDDGHPDAGLGTAEHEIEEERGLARAGRAEDRKMPSEGVGRQDERTLPRICYGDSRAGLSLAVGAWQRSFTFERQAVEPSIGQRPQRTEKLRVSRKGGRSRLRAFADSPHERLCPRAQRVGRADQLPQKRSRSRRLQA